jgi:hypothetical protein
MRALIIRKHPRPSRIDVYLYQKKVYQVVDELFQEDQDITIAAVSNKVSVCPETIRNWGCNSYIAKMKRIQKEQRRIQRKEKLYQSIDLLFNHHGVVPAKLTPPAK